MRRNAILTYVLSAVTLLAGIMMVLSGITKGWICIALAVIYTAFVVIATRVRASRQQR
ncbi:hypothetical protein [Streptomyces galbus]|uniref:Uncharacterized protein n=1 Tax=Streptomyces galbus TaxID=33898 RepID=A0ABX1IFV2_STRGB|nr:hypothetical protein [Streptomyces galbus]NKQ24541.1 hypothetical protein [Streptomyces galbus]